MLFNGADRGLKTKNGQTPLELFKELSEDVLEPGDYANLYRTLSPQRNCACMQTHRPINKVKRSSSILIMGVALNLSVIIIFYWGLHMFTMTP